MTKLIHRLWTRLRRENFHNQAATGRCCTALLFAMRKRDSGEGGRAARSRERDNVVI